MTRGQYLCNIFSDYHFDVEWMRKHERKVGPGHLTAMERIQLQYEGSQHFKGEYWDKYKSGSWMSSNLKSADGKELEHGQTVWLPTTKAAGSGAQRSTTSTTCGGWSPGRSATQMNVAAGSTQIHLSTHRLR